jgi:Kef-type K+ transport system membrane component KefB
LLGLFFLAVSASLDFSVIAAKPLLTSGLVLALILLKTVVLLAIATLLKIHGWHRAGLHADHRAGRRVQGGATGD